MNLTKAQYQAALAKVHGSPARVAGMPRVEAVVPKSARRVAGGRKAQRAGSSFQKAVQASLAIPACPLVLTELPSCGARFVGKGRIIRLPIPCDLVGCVRISGRAFHADAKSLGESFATFPLTNHEMVEPHQIAHLVRMGQAGAIAGLIVESKRRDCVLWLDWEYLSCEERIPWNDPRWDILGGASHLIDFGKIARVRVEIDADAA